MRSGLAARWLGILRHGWAVGLLACAVVQAATAAPAPTLRVEAGHHVGAIRRIAVSPDQALLATVSDDKTARVWQIAERRLLATLLWPVGDGDAGRMYGVAFSPDGRELAIGGTSGAMPGGHRLQVYSAANGLPLRTLALDAGDVVRLLWTRSGRHLAACLSGTHGVRILDAQTGDRYAEAFEAPCFGLAETADGAILASGYDGRIRRYRLQDGRWRLDASVRTELQEARSLAVSPDGRHVAVGYSSRPVGSAAQVDVLDTGTLALVKRYTFADIHRDGAGLGSVAWSRDGRTIAAAGRAAENGGYRLRVVLKRIAWPQGTARSDFVATDTVQDLAPWGEQGFVFGTGLGAWATVDAGGDVAPVGAGVMDLRGPDSLVVDADARTVGFGAEGWSGARHFSLVRRELRSGAPPDADTPRRFSLGLTVTEWQDRLRPAVAGLPLRMEPGEVSRAAALLPDGAGAIVGTTRTLRRIARDGREQWSRRPPSEIRAVHASKDGRLVVSTLLDGTVRWWRASDGLPLLTLFTSIDERWVLWTEEGYYDASPGAEALLGWQQSRDDGRVEMFSVGQFRDRYYRPDVIDKILELLDPQRALAAADADRRTDPSPIPAAAPPAVAAMQPPPMQPATPALPASVGVATAAPAIVQSPPVLRVFTERAVRSSSRELRIAFALEAAGPPVDALQLRVDGAMVEPARLQMPRLQDGRETGELVVEMPDRDASVMVVARAGSTASEPVFVAWRWVAEAKTAPMPGLKPAPGGLSTLPAPAVAGLTLPAPLALPSGALSTGPAPAPALPPASRRQRVYVVAIGVSEYRQEGLRLEFPAKDARDFAAFMKAQQGRMYSTVEVRTLVDAQATRAQVLEALDWLKSKVGAADIGMLFIAGHGVNDARGTYHFLAHDADPRELARTSVSEAEIRTRLTSLWGRALLFADTCHSGNVVGSPQAMNNELRRLANVLSAPESGVIVFSASTGRQTALENASWGNGAFTKALLEGLKGGADYRREGVVTHQGLSYFLGREVAKLTGGRQVPVTAVPMGMVDFALAAL
ncbi:MAG: caspase family protein [Rubrivivax sp.]|nr:caspase family protein [Rubrivivax sp.]